jgi:hypothetical protein
VHPQHRAKKELFEEATTSCASSTMKMGDL